MLDDIFEQLNAFVINTTGGQAAAEARQKQAAEQMAKIKDAEGVNVKKNTDGTLATTIGDSINNLIGKIGGSAPVMSDVQREYNKIGVQRKSSELIDKNPTIDYTGIDRSDYDAVQAHTDFQKQLKNAQSEGYDTTGVTNRAGLKTAIDEQDLNTRNKNTEGSIQWQTQRSDRTEDIARETAISDRNFGLQLQTLTNQNNQALASLKAQMEQAKMTNEQSILDREYLDRRDQRDYDYRIKKDDQESMDKIFALLIGGIDKIF